STGRKRLMRNTGISKCVIMTQADWKARQTARRSGGGTRLMKVKKWRLRRELSFAEAVRGYFVKERLEMA
ncbi:hypothetical protein ACSEO6_13205, partial [Pseudomonas aeruginosa]